MKNSDSRHWHAEHAKRGDPNVYKKKRRNVIPALEAVEGLWVEPRALGSSWGIAGASNRILNAIHSIPCCTDDEERKHERSNFRPRKTSGLTKGGRGGGKAARFRRRDNPRSKRLALKVRFFGPTGPIFLLGPKDGCYPREVESRD